MTEIVRLSSEDWEVYRDVRLAALEQDPSAFGSRLDEERRVTEDVWRDRLAHRAQFLAHAEGTILGTVGCLMGADGVAELVSMWVAPEARGTGVADSLVDAVLTEARERGCGATVLWVSDGNRPAERLYARRGFTRTGRAQPVAERDPSRGVEFEMRRDDPDADGRG